jgi:macrolide-specific efflux system membrane fusion protein
MDLVKKFFQKIVGIKNWFLKRSLKTKIVVILVVIVLGYLGYKRYTTSRNQQPQYQTAQAEKSTLIISVSASGSVVSSNQMPITTNASGIVSEVYVKDGDKVTKGQRIASIELDSDGAQRNAQAYSSYMNSLNNVKSAENNLRSAQASLNNVYDQLQGHATDETFAQIDTRTKAEVAKDNAYNSLQMAKIQVNSAYLSYLEGSPIITANYSGTVNDITVVPGMDLATATTSSGNVTSQSVAIIETSGLPLISVNVSEIDVPSVQQGQKATVTFDSIPNKTFTGKVVSVNRIGSVSSGVTNYPVIIQFDTEIPELLPNMTASANIIVDTVSDALLVPTTAVQTVNGQSTVRVLKDGKVTSVDVEVGKSSDSETQILSGLSEGDVVVTSITQSSGSQSTQTQSPFSSFGGGGIFRRTTTGGGASVPRD